MHAGKRERVVFILLLSSVTLSSISHADDRQRFDGWYNNRANPSWGSTGEDIIYRTLPVYNDLTYHVPAEDPTRPNPRMVSNSVLQGPSGLPSYQNRTTLFAYFGQMVAYEMVHATDSSCPVELIRVPVPKGDYEFQPLNSSLHQQLFFPFIRSSYNPKTGHFPNRPRQPVNKATSWIDGNFIYGRGEVWANALRAFVGGRLAVTHSTRGEMPASNAIRLPLDNYPNSATNSVHRPEDLWMAGDPHAHQNPGLLAISVLWFRYHNAVAKKLEVEHPTWRDERLFHAARRHVVAALQSIIMYEWLPALLRKDSPPYSGYKSDVRPNVAAMFEAVAFRIGHSIIPPGFYVRDKTCTFHKTRKGKAGERLCNTYFNAQEIIEHYGLEDFLLGMSSQLGEREDHIMVNDLRGKVFGPLHYTRHDLAVITIMRGRDHGVLDYNSARVSYGLDPITSWSDINPSLNGSNQEAIARLRDAYNGSLDRVDAYPAGLLESTPDSIGPLFSAIILDQFVRIRDADRFWFENTENGWFSKEEITRIRQIKLKDVLLAATNITGSDVQEDVFFWMNGDPCPQPKQMEEADLEPCTPHQGYDYFAGSEISYITAFTCLALVPFICVLIAYLIAKIKKANARRRGRQLYQSRLSRSPKPGSYYVLEWTGDKNCERDVELRLDVEQSLLVVLSHTESVLRSIDLTRHMKLMVWTSSDKNRNHLMIHVPREYDIITSSLNNAPGSPSLLSFRVGKLQWDLMEPRFGLVPLIERQYPGSGTANALSPNFSLVLGATKSPLQDVRCLVSDDGPSAQAVLRFTDVVERGVFVAALKDMLRAHGKPLLQHETSTKLIFDRAITKVKRQAMLTQFFRSVFAEAHNIKEIRQPDEIELHQCKEIVDCEITRTEFAEALALKPDSLFVNQMFSMIDRDSNGFISFRELLYAVLLFAQGSCEDKLELLFKMYDRDHSGSLSRSEVTELLRSMMEMANTSLSHDEVGQLVDQMFVTSGLERRTSLRFKDFTRVLSVRMDMLWDVCLDWKGTKICMPKKKPSSKSADGATHVAQGFGAAAEPSVKSVTRRAIFLKEVRHYVENHRQQIVYLFIFVSTCVLLFAERFYKYAVQYEHRGLRSITGYGISLTRGAAAGMSFTFSLLLLTMCRNVITRLRETVLNLYIPFDSHVVFHKIVAYAALSFTMLHIIGYCFNFYFIATQPVEFLCIFDEMYFRSDFLPKIHYWLFQTVPGFTGVLLVIIICIIYIFATATARTHIFNAFWTTHQLFYALYVLTLLHGSVRVVQDPFFPYYFVGPAILFTLDKLVSMSRKKRKLSIIRTELLPSDVTLLQFKRPANFEYRSGQWIRLACEPLGRDEYHSLTLTSAPHEDTLSVHVRAVGPWTSNLRKLFDPTENFQDSTPPKLYVDGPFGAGQQDWINYDISVLVGGGIGVTPYASIIKDFAFLTSVKNTFRMKCHKVYFIWVTASQKHFEWLLDILHTVEEVDKKEVIETHIFLTQLFNRFDLRTTMLYICEEHFQRMSGRSIFTGLKAKTHFGRPNFYKVLDAVRMKHPRVNKIGVFSCGPPGLTNGVQNACYEASKSSKAVFEHHFENF